jgi:hypothetical protein
MGQIWGAITPEPLDVFKSSWAFLRALIKGFLMLYRILYLAAQNFELWRVKGHVISKSVKLRFRLKTQPILAFFGLFWMGLDFFHFV